MVFMVDFNNKLITNVVNVDYELLIEFRFFSFVNLDYGVISGSVVADSAKGAHLSHGNNISCQFSLFNFDG